MKDIVKITLAYSVFLVTTVATIGDSNQKQIVRDLLSSDENKREAAQKEIVATGHDPDILGELTKIISDHQNQLSKQDSVRRAIEILGEMKDPQAVDVLVTNIGFPEISPPGTPPRREAVSLGDFNKTLPSVAALIKIGKPSVEPTLAKLASTQNVIELKACQQVLAGLTNGIPVLDILKNTIAKQTDPKKRERLQSSLDRLTAKP